MTVLIELQPTRHEKGAVIVRTDSAGVWLDEESLQALITRLQAAQARLRAKDRELRRPAFVVDELRERDG